MEYRKGFLATVPAKALIIFALGVFFLFCTIGIANDMANMGRQPALRYVLSVLLISICAVGYAAAGTTMRQRSWKVMVPAVTGTAPLMTVAV